MMQSSFIVNFWEVVFRYLGKISFFNFVRWMFPKAKTGFFSEVWALSHVFLSIASVPAVLYIKNDIISFCIAIYALLRVFEVVIYQINVLLFDEYRAIKSGGSYALHGYRRMIILLIQNYFEIIFWFAAQYIFFQDMFGFTVAGSQESILGAIYTSFVVMTSFGFYNVTPLGVLAYTLVIGQAMIGLFMTLLSLARFIGLIPNPKSMDQTEQ
ncbi:MULTISPECIES: hypothetical protein [Shewanella]|jgi:hypothetical protein|uniref:Potassium channel domain-containing protein n=1 Tax=Shewanella psychromarinicola TaxID=2487742 RepID=A0A3N4E5R2_9GAMM|nr:MULTISPECIES: hypothetical protein [Shewanella]AZG34086.1 hypothetical protein EGC80_03485 [Shewanella psychromarinicola]MCL1081246.1 hypothetical protein [Shewanella psychromarinicola]PKG79094.1 hypothetical protein CXF80_12665 [Shewanella sp. Actino-trap-3]RPA32178.1 hypothetical protein EGC77_10080 [Shewanella psychromarinicola]|tara:strand:- start:70736 stop:71371 length:636 start_codon:yes stop_codon:yes gene_type:complete